MRIHGLHVRRWAPVTWGALHGLAFLYPRMCLFTLCTVMCRTLPCNTCRQHFSWYMATHPPDTQSQEPLYWFAYVLDLHNDVNARLGKTVYCHADVLQRYRDRPAHELRAETLSYTWQMLWTMVFMYDLERLIAVDLSWDTLVDTIRAVATATDTSVQLPPIETLGSYALDWAASIREHTGPIEWWLPIHQQLPGQLPIQLTLAEDLVGLDVLSTLTTLTSTQHHALRELQHHRNAPPPIVTPHTQTHARTALIVGCTLTVCSVLLLIFHRITNGMTLSVNVRKSDRNTTPSGHAITNRPSWV